MRSPTIGSPSKRGLAFSALAAALFTGCATANFVPTGTSLAAKPDNCQIQVFSTQPPAREYEELGIIEGEGHVGALSLEDVLPEMKTEACRAGGDALILGDTQRIVEPGVKIAINITGTVIRWVGPTDAGH